MSSLNPDNTEPALALELTHGEAMAIGTALFMCLRPNTCHPPFEPLVDINALESGYRKIAGPVSELVGQTCVRCSRAWIPPMPLWDLIGDPETGELVAVCDDCATADERAAWDDHRERFAQYAHKLYSTPSWKSGPAGKAHQQEYG